MAASPSGEQAGTACAPSLYMQHTCAEHAPPQESTEVGGHCPGAALHAALPWPCVAQPSTSTST